MVNRLLLAPPLPSSRPPISPGWWTNFRRTPLDLRGRLVVLTGASSGLGPHIARRLRREGARFVLSARRRPELEALASELGDSSAVPADLSRRGEAERLAAESGEVDVLINNAGIPSTGRLETFSNEEIDRALEVNVRAAMVLTRALVPPMVARGRGHVIFLSSIGGKMPAAGAAVYNSTKYALRGFGLSLRQELRGTGVGVTVICPTFVGGAGMWAETGLRPPAMSGEVTPDEVAAAVLTGLRRDLGEIDVMPLVTRLGVRFAQLAPGLTAAITLRSGASDYSSEAAEMQRHKR